MPSSILGAGGNGSVNQAQLDAAIAAAIAGLITTEVDWSNAASGTLTFSLGVLDFTVDGTLVDTTPPPPMGAFDVDFTELVALPDGWIDKTPGNPVIVDSLGMSRPGSYSPNQWVLGPDLVDGVGTLTLEFGPGESVTNVCFWMGINGTRDSATDITDGWSAKDNGLYHFGGTTGSVDLVFDAGGAGIRIVMGSGGEVSVYGGTPGAEAPRPYTPFPYIDAGYVNTMVHWGFFLQSSSQHLLRATYVPGEV